MTYLESQHIQKLYLFLVEVQQPDPNLTGGHVLSKKALITAVADTSLEIIYLLQ